MPGPSGFFYLSYVRNGGYHWGFAVGVLWISLRCFKKKLEDDVSLMADDYSQCGILFDLLCTEALISY